MDRYWFKYDVVNEYGNAMSSQNWVYASSIEQAQYRVRKLLRELGYSNIHAYFQRVELCL